MEGLAELSPDYRSVPKGLAALSGAEMRAYNPTLRDRLARFLLGDERPTAARASFVEGLLGSRGMGSSGLGLADLTPAGIGLGVDEAVRQGDYQGAAVAMMPGGAAARLPKRGLPTDTASRMARAEAMGFRQMPLYHGTDREFTAFDLAASGRTSGAAPAQHGVWGAVQPEIADEFAQLAANKGAGNPQTLKLLHRSEKPASVTLTGDEKNHEIAATLAQAWDDGHTSVMLRNYTSPGGKKGDVVVVRDPAQLRVPTALFDPAKIKSRELLAGIMAGGVVGGAAMSKDQ